MVEHVGADGLIVLRSLGKFFGIAGVRCGFTFCDEIIRERLSVAVGPWAVSGPALHIATQALTDRVWQSAMRAQLLAISTSNGDLLQKTFAVDPLRHALFNSGYWYCPHRGQWKSRRDLREWVFACVVLKSMQCRVCCGLD